MFMLGVNFPREASDKPRARLSSSGFGPGLLERKTSGLPSLLERTTSGFSDLNRISLGVKEKVLDSVYDVADSVDGIAYKVGNLTDNISSSVGSLFAVSILHGARMRVMARLWLGLSTFQFLSAACSLKRSADGKRQHKTKQQAKITQDNTQDYLYLQGQKNLWECNGYGNIPNLKP
jgi:hypothetical protein